ncbi:MFS domain-containing protein [Mycena indigotica]|uniref:MFS domain-containing protein n=1 Tax=Mycena indigotica TaxID=2126181 RepID=A0A8H6SPU3_9AGAR|nr:MFS domain-containing protein [Mycena indigotica]KAF7302172.1 MFS domain-containing protein [Mycena indigotica]
MGVGLEASPYPTSDSLPTDRSWPSRPGACTATRANSVSIVAPSKAFSVGYVFWRVFGPELATKQDWDQRLFPQARTTCSILPCPTSLPHVLHPHRDPLPVTAMTINPCDFADFGSRVLPSPKLVVAAPTMRRCPPRHHRLSPANLHRSALSFRGQIGQDAPPSHVSVVCHPRHRLLRRLDVAIPHQLLPLRILLARLNPTRHFNWRPVSAVSITNTQDSDQAPCRRAKMLRAAIFIWHDDNIVRHLIQLYLVDTFTYAASALSAASVFRSLLGFAFPLFGQQMFNALGTGGGNSLLGGLGIVLGIPFPIYLYYHGAEIRQKSAFSSMITHRNADRSTSVPVIEGECPHMLLG